MRDHELPCAPPVWPLMLPMLAAVVLARAQSLSGKDLVGALQAGGYVILMRHASSPGIAPDAAHAEPNIPSLEMLRVAGLGRAVTFPQLGEPEHGLHDDSQCGMAERKNLPAPSTRKEYGHHYSLS